LFKGHTLRFISPALKLTLSFPTEEAMCNSLCVPHSTPIYKSLVDRWVESLRKQVDTSIDGEQIDRQETGRQIRLPR
jgi:hypothetical protein